MKFDQRLSREFRPLWMTAMAGFCLITLVFLVFRDFYYPDIRDVEVWFGFEVRGRAAILSAPLHWAIFAIGFWGFWNGLRWVVPCASAYSFYIALSHLIWSEMSPSGQGWPVGAMHAALFSLPGFLLLRASRP